MHCRWIILNIHIYDSLQWSFNGFSGEFDMRVKSCEASDGVNRPIQLSDERGCFLRPKMVSKFLKLRSNDGRSTVMSYAFFHAFKFPDSLQVIFYLVSNFFNCTGEEGPTSVLLHPCLVYWAREMFIMQNTKKTGNVQIGMYLPSPKYSPKFLTHQGGQP